MDSVTLDIIKINKMKKLTLFLILIPFAAKCQESINKVITKVNVVSQNVELAEKRGKEFNVLKGEMPDLSSIKGFINGKKRIYIDMSHSDEYYVKLNLEGTPFEFVTFKQSKKLKDKSGYLVYSLTLNQTDNNNFESTWIFRDNSRRTVYSFTTVNYSISEVLAKIGITTF
jgi:hypothetical protein